MCKRPQPRNATTWIDPLNVVLELDWLQAVNLACPAVSTAPGVNSTFPLGGVVVYANSGTSPGCRALSPTVNEPHAFAPRLKPTEPVTEPTTPAGAVPSAALTATPLPPRIELKLPLAVFSAPPDTDASSALAVFSSPPLIDEIAPEAVFSLPPEIDSNPLDPQKLAGACHCRSARHTLR